MLKRLEDALRRRGPHLRVDPRRRSFQRPARQPAFARQRRPAAGHAALPTPPPAGRRPMWTTSNATAPAPRSATPRNWPAFEALWGESGWQRRPVRDRFGQIHDRPPADGRRRRRHDQNPAGPAPRRPAARRSTFRKPRPAALSRAAPFRVQTEPSPGPAAARRPRRAAVSAFGFGGINAHLLLEEWVPEDRQAGRRRPRAAGAGRAATARSPARPRRPAPRCANTRSPSRAWPSGLGPADGLRAFRGGAPGRTTR